MSDAESLSAFEAAAIPRPEWTHEAHVRMAWLYLVRHPQEEALEKVRGGIQRLNAVIGSPDTTTLTIADNDAPGTIQFSVATYSVWENLGPAIVRVTRTGTNLASGTTVQFTTTNGTPRF